MPQQAGQYKPGFQSGGVLAAEELNRAMRIIPRRFLGVRGITVKVYDDQVIIEGPYIPQAGGSTIRLVQATADGSGGKVKVKSIQFKRDISASPNFEQSGAEYEVGYLKL